MALLIKIPLWGCEICKKEIWQKDFPKDWILIKKHEKAICEECANIILSEIMKRIDIRYDE